MDALAHFIKGLDAVYASMHERPHPNACDHCLEPLDPEADLDGQEIVTQLGRWCRRCQEAA